MTAPVVPVRTPFDNDPPIRTGAPQVSTIKTPFDDDPPAVSDAAVLGVTLNRAREGDPKAMAEGFALRSRTGLPADVIARNLSLVKAEVGDQDMDLPSFLNNHPATVKWLQDEANATVSRDDWQNLGKLERLVGRWSLLRQGYVPLPGGGALAVSPIQTRKGILQAEYEQSAVVTELGRLGLIPPTRRDAAVTARIAELEAFRSRTLPESEGTLESFLRASARIAPSIVESVEGGGVGAGVGAVVGGGIGAFGGPGGIVAGAAFGAKAGGLLGGASAAFQMEAGNAAIEFSKLTDEFGRPADPDVAYQSALVYGAASAGLEMVGIGLIARPFGAPIRAVLRQGTARALRQTTTRGALLAGARAWAGAVAGETATEVGQQLLQLDAEQDVRQLTNWLDDTSFEDVSLERVGREVLAVATETAMGMTLLALPGASVTTIEVMGRVAEAKDAKDRLTMLGETAEASVLRERSPEAFRAAIEADIAEHGPVETVGIPVDRLQVLLQAAGVSPDEFAASVLPDPSAYQQALVGGGDVVIPLADYIAKVAGTELHKAMIDDIRLRPGSLTAREAAEMEKAIEADAKAMRAEMEAAVAETPEEESAQRVVADLAERLSATGVYTPDQVAQMARAAAAPYIVLGKRTGQDPFALYQSRNIRVHGPARAGLIYNETRAVQAAEQRGASPEEVATLRSRLKRLTDERIEVRTVLDEADQTQDARDEAGRLRRDLRTVSTESLVLEFIALRDQVTMAEGEVAGVEASLAAAMRDAGNVATDEEFVGVLETAGLGGLLGDAETFGGKRIAFERSLRASRAVVARYARSVPRLAAELDARGVTNPDEYAEQHDLGLDASFDVAALEDIAFQSDEELMARIGEASAALPEDRMAGARETGFGRRLKLQALTALADRTGLSDADYIAVANKMASLLVLEQSRSSRPNAFIIPGKAEQVIGLMETADLSSFLHEMGHEYLNLLEQVAGQPDAPQSVIDDLATVLQQIGATSVATATREQQEVFARGFEAYLMEGVAPSRDLFRAFTRFRIWLTRIYDTVRKTLAPISPELRGVFDRLMATDEEIAAAKQASGAGPMFTSAEEAGMSDAEYASYLRMVELRDAQAGAHLAKTLLAERNKERTAEWQAREEEVRDIVAERVDAEPVERAVRYFRTGLLPDGTKHERPAKLHKALLVPLYGEGITKTLPKGTFSRTEGADADSFALLFGFPNGDALIAALQKYEPRTKRIERLVGEEMRRAFPDLLGDSPALAAAAQHSLHLAENDNLVIDELKALGRQTGMRPTNVKAVKRLAAEMVGSTRLRDLSPQRFLNAEAKAAKLSEEALKKGNRERAAFHKRQQLLNRVLYREATAVLERTEVVERFMTRMGKAPAQQRLGLAGAHYLDTMNGLLDQYEFRRVTMRELRRRESLLAFVQRVQEEEGLTLEVPASVLAKAERVNYRSLTADDLLGVYETAQQVWHVATTKDKLLKAQKAREIADIEAEIVGSIEAHHDLTPAVQDTRSGLRRRVARFLENADAWHLKPEWIFRELDGDVDAGPVWTHLFKPIADAENAENVRLEEARAQLEALFDMIPAERRGAYLERVIDVPGLTAKVTHGAALSLALNWGNAGNRDAILASTIHGRPQWTVEQVHAVLATLTTDEWAFVRASWEYINTYWPEIAALQQRLTGLAPDKVEADPFTITTADGTTLELPGGYYPLQYDSDYSWAQFKADVSGTVQDIGATSYTRAATRHGHTEARVGSGGKAVKLDLSVLTAHVLNVVHDLTHREAILDVNRLLERPAVRSAIEQSVGTPMYRALRPWLTRIANDQLPPASPVESLLGRARVGATVVNMGLKVTTAIVQPLGILQSVDLVGAKYVRRGLTVFFANPRKTWKLVKEQSVAMRNRQAAFDRDVRDIAKRKGGLDGVSKAWFYFTGLMDMSVAVPTWVGAYQKSIEVLAPGDHEAAVAYADSAVRLSQSGGAAKDLARIQGGPESMRLFTMFYSYFSALYGLGRRRVASLKAGRIGVPEFMGSVMLLWFLPAVVSELIAGRGPEDDEDAAAWAAWQLAQYPFGAMVGVRDLASALGPEGFSYELSPVTSAGVALADALRAVGGVVPEMVVEGEPDLTRREVKSIVEAVGYWGQLPARQMWITGTYLYDWMMGYDEPETPLEAGRNLAFPRRP